MAFDSSNYKEKYRWTGYDTKNEQVQLRILQRSSSSFTVKEIGGLSALTLSIQGGQGSIYAPIVKTSLAFTLVDMPSKSTSSLKHGDWEEFYTPDATLYLVQLYRYNDSGSFALSWSGFITPDSWQESLAYGGSITITARDNIGHLQDFEFDCSDINNNHGLVRICDLVYAALDLVDFPQGLTLPWVTVSSGATRLRDSHDWLFNAYIDASTKFEGKNWYEAISKTLEAIGYCLRFFGGNTFAVVPIRNLPLRRYGYRSVALAHAKTIEFYGGDRANDPAYKHIKEVVDFDAEDEIELPISLRLDLGNSFQSYSGKMWNTTGSPEWKYFTGYSCRNPHSPNNAFTKGGWFSGSTCYGFMRSDLTTLQNTLEAEDGAKAMDLGVNLAADMITGIDRIYRVVGIKSTDITVTCEFARPVEAKTTSIYFRMARLKDWMKSAEVQIRYTAPGSSTVYYWNGAGWQTEAYTLDIDIAEAIAESYKFSIPLSDISGTAALGGVLDINFYNFHTSGEDTPDYGSYVRLTAIKAKLNVKSVLKSDTVTTINNSDYNVKVERKPEFGAMSASVPFFVAQNYPGALWTYDANNVLVPYDYANYLDAFSASTAIPLPVQIHKQMLCFNHVSLTTLEGNCGLVDKSDRLDFNEEFYYKGKYYLLQSGTLDVLRNRLSSAIFHEYIWYPNLWDENSNPSYAGVPNFKTNSGSGDASTVGSSGSGGGSSSGGTVTSVGISVPTGLTTSGSPITTAGTIAISLASGYKIPTTTEVSQGATAYSWGNHANAGYATGSWGSTYGSGTSADLTLGGTTRRVVLNAAMSNYASASTVNNLASRVGALETSGWPLTSTPRLTVYHGIGVVENEYDKLIIRRPCLGVAGYEAVLMIYRGRNGRKTCVSPRDFKYYKYKKGWAVALGPLDLTSHVALTTAGFSSNGGYASFSFDTLRDFIIKRFMVWSGYTQAQLYSMSYNDWHAVVSELRGFRAKGHQYGSCYRRFGIAIRYENPDFTNRLAPGETLSVTTQEIERTPRYLYSPVAPLEAYLVNMTSRRDRRTMTFGVLWK